MTSAEILREFAANRVAICERWQTANMRSGRQRSRPLRTGRTPMDLNPCTTCGHYAEVAYTISGCYVACSNPTCDAQATPIYAHTKYAATAWNAQAAANKVENANG